MMRAGCVAGPLAAALIASPAAGEPVTVHTHASQRYDRPTAALAADIRRHTAAADLLTVTEIQEPARARVLHRQPGWGAYTDPRTDLGIAWDRTRWRLIGRPRAWHLTRAYPDVYGAWALAVVLAPRAGGRPLFVTVAHLPSAVEDGPRWRAGRHPPAWRAAVNGWHRRIRAVRLRRPLPALIAADWNLDLRRPGWRRVVSSAFPAQHLTWAAPLPARGTHAAGRLIDGTLTTLTGRARLLPKTPASDHTAYSERLYRPRR
jgi:hypothetical protein